MKLKIYSVSDKYVNYLRQFDNKIYDNKADIRTHTRKYVGVVISIGNINYYIPMSSPKKTDYLDKECTKIRPSMNTIVRMTAKNKDEIAFLRDPTNEKNIINKAKLVHKQKINSIDIKYLDNCVNYKLLEEKCIEYSKVTN